MDEVIDGKDRELAEELMLDKGEVEEL